MADCDERSSPPVIPLLDLQAQYRSIKSEIDTAVLRVLDSGKYVLGDEVKAFEKEFAQHCGVSEVVAVNSGTSALHLALLATGVSAGDEVVTVPFTFVATVATITYTGATPVFVDIDPVSYTLDPDKIEARITPRTKAIVPVHLYGHAADMDPILSIGQRHGLKVIEDASQAHLGSYQGRPCGSLGDIAAFSFYPGKNFGAYGEGGAVVTNNDDLARRMRMLRDWGQAKKYEHLLRGFNYRMDEIQAAILRVKLRHLEGWTEARRRNATLYSSLLKSSPAVLPAERSNCRHVYHAYTVRVPDRNSVQAKLQKKDIQTGVHYPVPVHLQPAYSELGAPGDFPEAERAAAEVLSLPIYPELTTDQITNVASSFSTAANGTS
tara:strand:- start:4762 stop:5898 length:1137 start_codon:yes stop_codon:yes gene_type:complete